MEERGEGWQAAGIEEYQLAERALEDTSGTWLTRQWQVQAIDGA